METTKLAQEKVGWRWIAAALVLAVFLAGALMMSVAAQNHPADTQHTTPNAIPAQGSISSSEQDPGNFAWGYVEFDQDPKAPGGIPGFDHWPPGAPRRR
jgi:hypothetical protein